MFDILCRQIRRVLLAGAMGFFVIAAGLATGCGGDEDGDAPTIEEIEEIKLGSFRLQRPKQPSYISIAIFGTVATPDLDGFKTALEKNEARMNDAITRTLLDSDTLHHADPAYLRKTLRREIETALKLAAPETTEETDDELPPKLHEVYFPEYNVE